jgi:2'-hydroxyisoflavone reductase
VRLLVLGGTRFVGRHVVEAALAAGWDVTLFNRGRHDPGAFPEAEHRVGDRDGGLDALRDGSWDAVIDTSGYVPRLVRESAALLSGRVGRYVFISSVSAYADPSQIGITEDAALAHTDGESADYGSLKAGCERVVQQVMGERAVVVRPGVIVGPHDPTNRFTHWVTRIAAGGDVLVPEPRDQPVQVIDARDLAAWLVQPVAPGIYNAVGDVTTLEELLGAVVRGTGSDAQLCWVEERRLRAAGVEPWDDLPLWLADPSFRGFLAMSNERAKATGLELRPLEETARDTLAWARTAPAPAETRLDPERERALLAGG